MSNLIKNGNRLIKINNKLISNAAAASGGETWVLNQSLNLGGKSWSYNINFTSNGNSYSKFSYNFVNPLTAYLVYGTTNVYNPNTLWSNEAYRTITFDQPVTNSELLSWLQNNGIKSGSNSGGNIQ